MQVLYEQMVDSKWTGYRPELILCKGGDRYDKKVWQ